MKPKILFQKCRKEIRDINRLEQRREYIISTVFPGSKHPKGDKIQTSPRDHISDAMAIAVDIERDIDARLVPLLRRQLDAYQMLDRLNNPQQREALEKYYLTYAITQQGGFRVRRMRSWAMVADEMGYSEKHVKNLCWSAFKIL